DDRLVDTIAHSERIVPYIDIPLQHINDTMLRRMARRVNRRETEALLDKLRERIPNLALRTTFITGFPGETKKAFAELEEFVRKQRLERLGVFTYSLEPDTPAAALPDHVPEKIKEKRRNRLMQIQQDIAFQWNRRQVGKVLEVLLDQPVPGQDDVWIGRTYAD